VVLVPVTPEHVAELRRLLATPEVRRRWRAEDASSGWPFDDSSSIRFAIVVDGAVRGMVQYGEEENPDYRHASIDIFIDPAAHGLGWGARRCGHSRSPSRATTPGRAAHDPRGGLGDARSWRDPRASA